MLMGHVRVVPDMPNSEPDMPNSIWMLSSEESNIEECQINMIKVFNKLSNVTKANL